MNSERSLHSQPVPSVHSSHEDEVDLWQLATILWAGKLGIIAVAIVCGFGGLWFAKTAEEEWTAKAQVTAPDYADFQNATESTQKLLPILNGQILEERITAIKFNDGDAAFARFISLFNSFDNKKEFLQQHEVLDQYKKLHEFNEEGEEKVLNRWASGITANAAKAEPENFDLSTVSWTATNSHKLLVDYIDFTNNQIIEKLQINLASLLANRINELESQLRTREHNAKMNMEREINLLIHSLAIAKAAGIETPIVDPGTNDVFEINLGRKAIQAKIAELKSIKNLAVMDVEILNIRSQLAEAEAIEFNSLPVFNSYKFTQRPAAPLYRSAPKISLIVLAAAIAGGILAAIYALLSHAIRSRLEAA